MSLPRLRHILTLFWIALALRANAQTQQDKAVSLNGTDFFRTYTWSHVLFPDENISVELWFNAAGPGTLVSEVDTADPKIWDTALAEILPDGSIKAGAPGVPTIDVGTIAFNTWHQLTFSYNRTNDTFAVWLDGASAGSSIGDRQTATEAGRTYVICFGRGGPTNLGSGGYLTGRFDEVRIWNIAIDESRVAATWNKILTENAPGLGALWHFDEANGSEVPDSRGVPAAEADPALHVPLDQPMPLVLSGTPLVSPIGVQTLSAGVTNRNVTLNGIANGRGQATTVYFEWGTTTAYGNTTPEVSIGASVDIIPFYQTLSNLALGDYHYRAIVKTASETAIGDDVTFTVLNPSRFAVPLNGAEYFRTTQWSDALFPTDDFTFELSFNASGPGILINEADNADPNVWDQAFAEVFPGGIIKAGVPGLPTITAGTVEFGTWHHLAITYNQSATLFSVYVDGALAGTSTGERTSPRDIGRVSVYCIGRGGPTNLGGGNWFTGVVDEAHIWRRALSSAEIASGYNKVLASVGDPTLLANWHFDDFIAGSPSTSSDASGRNNKAWHVPDANPFSLIISEAPLIPDLRPALLSQSATNVTAAIAQFQVVANARGLETDVFLEVGQSNVFQPALAQRISGETNSTVVWTVTNLVVGQTYQFRISATNAQGIVTGATASLVKSGWQGNALRLAPNDYLRTTANQNTNFTSESITIELWFLPRKTGVLVSETTFPTTSMYDRSIIEVLPSGSVQAGFNGLTAITLGDATFDQWNHVALRYDHTTQTMDGFLNGVKGPSRTGDRITPVERGVLGYYAFGRTAFTKLGPGEYFGGDMDEIRIWNAARTDQEIVSASHKLLAGDEPGLILYWRLDIFTTSIIDLSGKNNRGSNLGAEVIVSSAPLSFQVDPIRRTNATDLAMEFLVGGGSYLFQSSPDLVSWTTIGVAPAPATGVLKRSATLNPSEPSRFYRVIPQ